MNCIFPVYGPLLNEKACKKEEALTEETID